LCDIFRVTFLLSLRVHFDFYGYLYHPELLGEQKAHMNRLLLIQNTVTAVQKLIISIHDPQFMFLHRVIQLKNHVAITSSISPGYCSGESRLQD